jgi:hypothetical protein
MWNMGGVARDAVIQTAEELNNRLQLAVINQGMDTNHVADTILTRADGSRIRIRIEAGEHYANLYQAYVRDLHGGRILNILTNALFHGAELGTDLIGFSLRELGITRLTFRISIMHLRNAP